MSRGCSWRHRLSLVEFALADALTRTMRHSISAAMRSFRDVLADHAPILLVDAASAQTQLGWLEREGRMRWEASDEEAGTAIFRCVEALAGDLDRVGAFAFCEGPGSILGIRSAAMALRVWQVVRPRPIMAYQSLALVASALEKSDVLVIADARRGVWHGYRKGLGLQRLAAAEVGPGAVMPEPFRHWAPLPPGVGLTPYVVADLIARAMDAPLLHETTAPDAFLHQEPEYVRWKPQIHRAPGSD